jgi:membrane protein DedA with SNARE-associated domain
MGELIDAAVFWVVARVRDWGYLGIFVMMTIESSFVPFPSEVAMIPAGYLASRGEMSPLGALAAGLGGSLLGAYVNYALANTIGRAAIVRMGRYVLLGVHHLEASERWFARHGEITTFVGRLVPGIRQLISVPAGLARMPLARFTLFTGLGAGLWSAVLIAVGFWAGANEEVWRPLVREATLWVLLGVGVLIAVYIWIQRKAERMA